MCLSKYASGPKLIPENGDDDDKAYGLFEQACSVEQSYFAAACETIGTELVIKKYSTLSSWRPPNSLVFSRVADQSGHRAKGLGPPDETRVAQAEAALDQVLAYYDEILAKRKYLAGDGMTLADLFHLPNGSAMIAFGYKGTFERYPNVMKWFTGLQERETWVKAAAVAGTVA